MAGVTSATLVAGAAAIVLSVSCAGPGEVSHPISETSRTEEAPSGPYLGQKPPGSTPSLFAPGFISTGLAERDVAMTPGWKRALLLGPDGGWSVQCHPGDERDRRRLEPTRGGAVLGAAPGPRAGDCARRLTVLLHVEEAGSRLAGG